MADPVWLKDRIAAEGVPVSDYVGGTDRGHGDFGNWIWGVIVHHMGAAGTAGPRSIAEHPDLGLASQIYLGRDGKAVICGVGIAYHAGRGSWPGLPKDNANPVTIGIEAENSGTEGWSSAQYWSYVRICAAILRKLGYDASRVIAHKEWAGPAQGKWDPGGLNMDKFRADIQEVLDHRDTPPPVRNEIDHTRSFSDWLGKRLFEGEREAIDGGKYVDFEHGSIYFHPKTGALPVPTHVYEVWKRYDWERGPLGYPTRYHIVIPGEGDIQEFYGAGPDDPCTIARPYGTAGYLVHGAIGARWRAEGDVRVDRGSTLGWPTSDEYAFDGGRRQDFEHGSLVWRPDGVINLTATTA